MIPGHHQPRSGPRRLWRVGNNVGEVQRAGNDTG